MKNVSEMTAEELDKALFNVTKSFKTENFPQDSALDSNGNFKKFSLYEDFDISYSVNTTTL
jgi:hypothetical protein